MPRKKILVIEDSDPKWRDINRMLRSFEAVPLTVERAATMEEADSKARDAEWDLILLDISMDIRTSAAGPKAGGHDAIGGLKIAERLFLLGHNAPVIIVTAFDAFPAGRTGTKAILGMQDVEREASSSLGLLLVGWVRYGDPDWEASLRNLMSMVLK
jgi:CheY-like chemotaxis protein